MRDRLIKKISIMEEMVVDPKANFKITDVQRILRQAREMLEKAIVPPCKVGQTLYFLYDRHYSDKPYLTTQIYETNEWYFDIDENGISIKPRFVHGYKGKYHYYLGKTVFLTREEAEQALKGGVQE